MLTMQYVKRAPGLGPPVLWRLMTSRHLVTNVKLSIYL